MTEFVIFAQGKKRVYTQSSSQKTHEFKNAFHTPSVKLHMYNRLYKTQL